MSSLQRVQRALISVSDKQGLVPFAQQLVDLNIELISTGGTANTLRDAGLPVTPVDQVTRSPEMLDGRVKTLHPAIHGGILARRDRPDHLDTIDEHNIQTIDLVCVNLYPFEQTIADPGVTEPQAIEQIDIGGPAMLRSAAKNFAAVTVITGPDQYDQVLQNIRANRGATSLELRRKLAAVAFARTAEYDRAIHTYLTAHTGNAETGTPADALKLHHNLVATLRYGENPHQSAAVYRDPNAAWALTDATQHHGKELSYNNINDTAAAVRLAHELSLVAGTPAAAVVKHTNPCGAAVAPTAARAADAALAGDPVAAYGGIVAIAGTVDLHTAGALAAEGRFLEVIFARAFDPAALQLLTERWKNVRLLESKDWPASGPIETADTLRSIPGGILVQTPDTNSPDADSWAHAAGPVPDAQRRRDAAVVWTFAKHLTSNAIAIGGPDPQRSGAVRLFGAGAGQMDRVAACSIAIGKAGSNTTGAIAASDAFFPFDDGPRLLIDAGVSTLIHPGGSKRDNDTFQLCNHHAVTCITTGIRHFRH